MQFDTTLQQEITNIEESKALLNAFIYPNPAANIITLKLNGVKTNYSFTIYNMVGGLVQHYTGLTQPETTIDISTLATGLYTYRIITTDGKTTAGRFVKE